jgi:hypothetical protein
MLSTLAPLPAAELAAGYTEVVKTALIVGGTLAVPSLPLGDALAPAVTWCNSWSHVRIRGWPGRH